MKRSTFSRMLRLARPFWRSMVLAAIAGTATVASSIGLLAASAYIISFAALHPSIAVLQTAIVAVRFFGLSRGILRYVERLQSHRATFELLAGLRTWFFNRLEPLAPAGLVDQHGGDLLSRLVADIETLEEFYVRVLAPPVVAVVVGLTLTAVYASISLSLAAVIFICLCAGGILLPFLTSADRSGRKRLEIRASRDDMLLVSLAGRAEIAASNRQESRLDRLDHISHLDRDLERRMSAIQGFGNASILLLKAAAAAGGLIIAIPLVLAGELNGIYLAIVTLASLAAFEAISPLPEAFQHLRKNLAAADRLFIIADRQPSVVDQRITARRPTALDLEIRHLSFYYEPGNRCVLQDISFTIPPGTTTAILGSSGSGKSTLANLLLRLWEYDHGNILLGGRELRELRQEDIRRMISVVPQRVELFYGSVFDNLLVASPDASREEAMAALHFAQIRDFVHGLPEGIDSCIGESGLLLSAGERQRIALARAFLKQAPILILDEPDTHLDFHTQSAFLDAALPLLKTRTVIWITHRMNVMDHMDQILVLHRGRIVERGKHTELINRGDTYTRMWTIDQEARQFHRSIQPDMSG